MRALFLAVIFLFSSVKAEDLKDINLLCKYSWEVFESGGYSIDVKMEEKKIILNYYEFDTGRRNEVNTVLKNIEWKYPWVYGYIRSKAPVGNKIDFLVFNLNDLTLTTSSHNEYLQRGEKDNKPDGAEMRCFKVSKN